MSTKFMNLLFAQEMLDDRKRCHTCYHNRDNHCTMQSSGCATDIFKHVDHPRQWLSYEEGEEQERLALG